MYLLISVGKRIGASLILFSAFATLALAEDVTGAWHLEGNMEILAVAASFAAIVISVYSLTFKRRLEHETSTQTLIHDQYELCRVLDLLRVEHPEVSHMLALPAQTKRETWRNYQVFKNHVRQLIAKGGPVTDAERGRLYLKEHATALHVCDIYEQTLLQRQLAEKAGDKNRFEVLDALAQYYEKRMLRSPRLRFHWDHGASDMVEQSTRDRYDEMVREHPGDWPDPQSPLDDAVEDAATHLQ
jgi:hypothetical protein